MDSEIGSLSKNFAEGTDYFRMLVSVFSPQFRDPQNVHLKTFHLTVPALTINFVENIFSAKDKMAKKKAGTYFTDDGFAIGVAFILKLLDQHKAFESLHWFEELDQQYQKELQKLRSEVTKQKKEEQQTTVITAQRLKERQREYDLLRFSFHGAKVFFNE